MSKKNPLVFLDVSIDGDPGERMVFELFLDVAAKTAENFRALCTGEKGISSKVGRPLHYKGSFFHRIIKGSMAQGGDFLKRDGTYGESIYGEKFPDEPPKLKHDGAGLLSMSIADRDTRGSLFIITFKANHHLDRKSVVFGKLVQGHEVLQKIESVGDEEGRPAVTVKIINSGEFQADTKKGNKLKIGKDGSSEANNHEVRRKGKHKKSSKRRKKRRRHYSSESESSSDTDMESSEADSDSDSDTSSSSDLSSSSDDRRKKRKRSYKREKHRRGKRRDKRREKKRKKRDKRSKRRSKRASDSLTDTESESKSESNSDVNEVDGRGADRKHKNQAQLSVDNQLPLVEEIEAPSLIHKELEVTDIFVRDEVEFPKENGEHQRNGIEAESKSDKTADRPDMVVDLPGKSRSRSRSISPRRTMSKSMSVSPKKSLSKSPSVSPKGRRVSRSPSVSRSPPHVSNRSRSISRSPARSDISRSPIRGKKAKSISRSPVRSRSQRTPSRSPSLSPIKTSSRKSSRRSVSRSPLRVVRKSLSRSPFRSSRRSISRSPVRVPARSNRRSYSRSSVRARSPVSNRGKSSSRSPSPDVSPKRIRRGRGFSDRYSYARRYRTRSPSPVRSYHYGVRNDRDRYSSYRRSPRRYRSPPRGRTPPRYRSRRSRTRSPSRSPIRYRNRRCSPSRSPIRSRSPIETSKLRESPLPVRRRSPSRSRSPLRDSSSSLDSQSPKRNSKEKSMSSSESLPAKKGLVSYGGGSPDSGQR